jgi:hypothetical protein
MRRSLTGGRGKRPILGGSQAAGAGLTYLPYRPKPAAPPKNRAFQKAGDNKALRFSGFGFQQIFIINISRLSLYHFFKKSGRKFNGSVPGRRRGNLSDPGPKPEDGLNSIKP